jgi:hypothetical protein
LNARLKTEIKAAADAMCSGFESYFDQAQKVRKSIYCQRLREP